MRSINFTETAAAPLVRLRLDLSYDGTHFSGWARQRDQRTVQGVLTELLSVILRTPVTLTVAGRTDSGVHATGQVAHIDVPEAVCSGYPADSLLKRLNRALPPDIRVHRITAVTNDFHARFAALRRHYRYRIADAPHGSTPLRRWDTLSWPHRLDQIAMNEAAKEILGEHDFAAFCRRRPLASTIRCLEQLEWRREPTDPAPAETEDILVAHVAADAFCHSMVRSLVGALIAVGEGRREADWPGELLRLTERASSVTVAPAHGLTLVRVDYPEPEELAARALITRQRRSL
ncbi:MAG: tRNA pseudouridine(38-40) synthase TruA [Mycobacteriales bacterium]